MRFLLLFLSAIVSPLAIADEPIQTAKDAEELPMWRRYSDLIVKQHKVTLMPTDPVGIKLIEQPVFLHHHDVGREEHALVYLWTTDIGRPVAAITAIVSRETQEDNWNEVDEFHSFHDNGFTTTQNGKSLWTPTVPGVEWVEVPKAPNPGATLTQQSLQARQIARRFSVNAIYHRETGQSWNLRLIPTPIHRYSTMDSEQLISGYLHAFCRQTDPESMLALEVRKNVEGKYRWYYGPANYSNAGVHLLLDGTEVWSEDPARFERSYRHFGYYPRRNFSLKAALEELEAVPE